MLRYFSLYGSNQLQSALNMFRYCSELLLVKQLDTSNVTDMSNMFEGCKSLQAIPQLNTSNTTNMERMFCSACYSGTTFNLDLSG